MLQRTQPQRRWHNPTCYEPVLSASPHIGTLAVELDCVVHGMALERLRQGLCLPLALLALLLRQTVCALAVARSGFWDETTLPEPAAFDLDGSRTQKQDSRRAGGARTAGFASTSLMTRSVAGAPLARQFSESPACQSSSTSQCSRSAEHSGNGLASCGPSGDPLAPSRQTLFRWPLPAPGDVRAEPDIALWWEKTANTTANTLMM